MWDQTRVWARRWVEVVAALILSKVVIVVTFVVGASAFSGTGPTLDPHAASPAAAGDGSGGGLSDVLVGLLLLGIAVCSPWLTYRFVHWTGMEAASVMHGAVAANPMSSAARASASQARFTAQQALTSSVLAGAGAGAAARRPGGNARAGGNGAAGPLMTPDRGTRRPPPRPSGPSGPGRPAGGAR